MLVIIGASGSGKSTLLRCVNLLEPVSGGRIFFEGEEITRKGADLSEVRRHIGIVFQQFNLFPHLKVIDNLTLAPRRILKLRRAKAEERALELLAPRGPGGEGPPVSAPALGRPAAARRDRPRADDGAARDAVRRGHLGPRPGARGRGADRDEGSRGLRHDDAGRDARDAVRTRSGRRADLHRRGSDRRAREAQRTCSTSQRRSARAASFVARSSSSNSLDELSIDEEGEVV